MIEIFIVYAINIFSRGASNIREFDDIPALLKAQAWGMLQAAQVDDFLGPGNGNNLIRLAKGGVEMREFKLVVKDQKLQLLRFDTELLSAPFLKRSGDRATTFYVLDDNGWEYQIHCMRPEDVLLYRQ